MSVVPSRPLALPADIFLVTDEYILNRAKVNISSGIPTAGVELSSADFLKIFQGTFSCITER
jgi:prolyl-tRNA editing enzyme YbaK/EbsC (Cys-tRNA(Pro) deacylase)